MNADTPTGTEQRSEPLQTGQVFTTQGGERVFVADTHRITLALAQVREIEMQVLMLRMSVAILAGVLAWFLLRLAQNGD